MGVTNFDSLQGTYITASAATTPPPAWLNAWGSLPYTPTVTIYRDSISPYADVGMTSAATFDLFSTARSAPANTYYVATTGNDSTGNGTSGSPWATIGKAITAGNASAAPFSVSVAAGTYARGSGFNGAIPTQDVAFIATGGRVKSTTHDASQTYSADATFTNTYSATVANVHKVVDLTQFDRFGKYVELLFVSTPALCNIRPGTWSYASGVLYINRADGAAVSNTNTRMYRALTEQLRISSNISVYMDGADAGSGFDCEGGNFGGINYQATALAGSYKAVIANNCTFRYVGGLGWSGTTSTPQNGNGVSIESLHGLALFFNCDASGNNADGFNAHNQVVTAAQTRLGTINCTANDNGRGTNSTSNNGWTIHETCVGFDFCGSFDGNRGGTMRPILNTYSWWVGSSPKNDLGDLMNGGSVLPAAIQLDNSAQAWLDNVQPVMPAGQTLIRANSGTSLFMRNMLPLRSAVQGTGTVGTY